MVWPSVIAPKMAIAMLVMLVITKTKNHLRSRILSHLFTRFFAELQEETPPRVSGSDQVFTHAPRVLHLAL